MIPRLRSLRVRLLAAATLSVVLALLLAAWGLIGLFEAHVERRLDNELQTYLRQLVGGIEIHDDDRIHQELTLADPRFAEPFSGLYWQIEDESHATLLRSRSLWDQTLALPADDLSLADVHRHQLPGPQGQSLMIREQRIILRSHTEPRRLRVAVAMDRQEITTATRAFATDMWPYLILLAGFLMLASTLQVRVGLSPMKRVREGVAAVRSGKAARLSGDFPEEITPLVDEINELLDASDAAVDKARSWTGDLAHGLKTPLTTLSTDVQQLRQQGQEEIAGQLEPLIESMRIRLDRELVRARLRSHITSRIHRQRDQADLSQALLGVQSTLSRTPDGQSINWTMDLPETLPTVNMHPADLSELLGNLLENACKWSRSQIIVRFREEKHWNLSIEDDGPGVDEEELIHLGQRGLRLDETITGHGLGLAIVRDICEAYAIGLTFSRSGLGGLSVRLRIPIPDHAPVVCA